MLRSNCTLGRKSSNAKFFTSLVLHGIELTDPTPVWTPPYPIPINQDQFLKRSQNSFLVDRSKQQQKTHLLPTTCNISFNRPPLVPVTPQLLSKAQCSKS
jgi:hypothetical protein